MKQCSRCKEIKPLDQFYRNRRTRDGRAYYCKVCYRARAKEEGDRASERRGEDTTVRARAGAKPGSIMRKPMPEVEPPRESERPTLPYVAPLYATFDQPKPEGAYFDASSADKAIDWIESNLRHFQGRWAGTRMYLLAWEARIVSHIFGWRRADGTRLIRTVYLEVPRKAGKSTLASAVALYLAYGDDEAGPQVFFAAYDKDQAAVCYTTARHMVEAAPHLFVQSQIYNSKKEITLLNNPGGILRCLSSDARKQYGLNLHGLIFDELMTQKTRELWDSLSTSFGSREQPLHFNISTAGWDQTSICYEQHEHTRQIAEGTVIDESFLGVIYGAPIDADWTSEEVWKRANPSLEQEGYTGETVKLDYYRQACRRAKAMPTEQNAFRTLYLSQWVGQAERFIDMVAWDRNADEPVPAGVAFGGLDLAATTDLAAFVVVTAKDGAEPLSVFPFCFLPEDGLLERERRDRVPYSTWAQQGYLHLTPGSTIDYAYIREKVNEAREVFDLQDVSYDRWNATQLVGELEDDGLTMVKVGQGFGDLSSPTKELLRLTMDAQLRHGSHPVLRWCASNVAARQDPAGNVKPDKEKSAHRIDPVVALIMAIDGWIRRGRKVKKDSVYKRRRLAVA